MAVFSRLVSMASSYSEDRQFFQTASESYSEHHFSEVLDIGKENFSAKIKEIIEASQGSSDIFTYLDDHPKLAVIDDKLLDIRIKMFVPSFLRRYKDLYHAQVSAQSSLSYVAISDQVSKYARDASDSQEEQAQIMHRLSRRLDVRKCDEDPMTHLVELSPGKYRANQYTDGWVEVLTLQEEVTEERQFLNNMRELQKKRHRLKEIARLARLHILNEYPEDKDLRTIDFFVKDIVNYVEKQGVVEGISFSKITTDFLKEAFCLKLGETS